MHLYKDLLVWQKAIELSVDVYELTEQFPAEQKNRLADEMRRKAVKIASIVAEAKTKEKPLQAVEYLRYAYTSAVNLETQLEIAKKLRLLQNLNFQTVERRLDEVLEMLFEMMRE